MKHDPTPSRRGMTLVELTVVVVILCLLAVTVLPVLNRSPNKSFLREGAAAVQGHIAQGISKSIGSRTGYGVWFDFDLSGTTTGNTTATTLAFCPGMTIATGAGQFSTSSGTATTATLTPAIAAAAVLGPLNPQFPTGTLISFMGYPYEYLLAPTGMSASFRTDAMQTVYNTTFPYNTSGGTNPTYSWVVSVLSLIHI